MKQKESFMNELGELQEIRKSCDEKHEDVLCFYTDCLIKMHKAYCKVLNTGMLFYVKQIMEPAFPMIITCFAREVRNCLTEVDAEKKYKLQEDIERSVVKFGEMFEAVINSTNGADRMLLQSAPVDPGIRYASPKLCSYYSGLLNSYAKLVEDTNGGKYAFCVYPALTSSCEAHIMFHREEQHGKVCIIQIPENRIGNIPYVIQVLFHEFFHILPSQYRKRKNRTERLNRIYVMALWSFLINGCEHMTEKDNEHLQDMLLLPFQNKCAEHYEEKDNDSREFYSIPVKSYYADAMVRFLVEIQGIEVEQFLKCLETVSGSKSFQDYRRRENKVKSIRRQIFANAMALICTDKIQDICNFYMLLFREPLSDLLAVVALRLPPKEYYRQLIMRTNGLPRSEELSENHLLYLRASFVTEVLRDENSVLGGYSELTEAQRKLLTVWGNIENYVPDSETDIMAAFIENMRLVSPDGERHFLSNVLEHAKKAKHCEENGKNTESSADAAQNGDAAGSDSSPSEASDIGDGKLLMDNKTLPLYEDIWDEYTEYFRECCRIFFSCEYEKNEEFQSFLKDYYLDQPDEKRMIHHVGLKKWDLE